MARRAVIGRGGSHADRYPAAAGARREPSDVPGSNGWRRPPRGGSDTAPPRIGCRGREPVPICVSAPDCRADFTPCDSSNLLKFSVFLEYEIIFQMQVVSPNLVGNSGRKWCAIGDRSVRRRFRAGVLLSQLRDTSSPGTLNRFSRNLCRTLATKLSFE